LEKTQPGAIQEENTLILDCMCLYWGSLHVKVYATTQLINTCTTAQSYIVSELDELPSVL